MRRSTHTRASAHAACSREQLVVAGCIALERRERALGLAGVAERDERVPSQPARVVARHVEPVVRGDERRAVGLEPGDEVDVRGLLRQRSARRFSTPRFHGQTSWQMSQP